MRERVFRTSFGRSVKRARDQCGLTQRKLADASGVSEKYVSRIELGLTTPSALVAFRIASALGGRVDDLIASHPAPVNPALAAVARLLRERSDAEIDRARRVLVELFR